MGKKGNPFFSTVGCGIVSMYKRRFSQSSIDCVLNIYLTEEVDLYSWRNTRFL